MEAIRAKKRKLEEDFAVHKVELETLLKSKEITDKEAAMNELSLQIKQAEAEELAARSRVWIIQDMRDSSLLNIRAGYTSLELAQQNMPPENWGKQWYCIHELILDDKTYKDYARPGY